MDRSICPSIDEGNMKDGDQQEVNTSVSKDNIQEMNSECDDGFTLQYQIDPTEDEDGFVKFSDDSIDNNICPSAEGDIMKEEVEQEVEDILDLSVSNDRSQETNLESNGCTLRHRIDPEPSKAVDAEDGFVKFPGGSPKTTKDKRKIAEIRKALQADPVDIAELRRLAISPGGLLNKSLRQKVWPLLINANPDNISPKPSQEEMEAYTKTYCQVVMDVNRSSSRFPPGIDDHVRMSMKDKLVDLVMRVLLKHKQLQYYQGFHDVCITFLLCMDEDLAFAMVEKLALGHMREYLDETMERTSLLLNYVYPLINRCNPELCQHMQDQDLGTIFSLSWVITWFSHVLGDIRRILRVFDFFLGSHRLMPVYLSAAFVLYREADIYEAGEEMGYIHKCLSTIPNDLPLESLLERAGDLYLQYPPLEISNDPMLLRMNQQTYDHFERIKNPGARRRQRERTARDARGRLFVRTTMWTVTAVIGVAAVVIYHTYSSNTSWGLMGLNVWS